MNSTGTEPLGNPIPTPQNKFFMTYYGSILTVNFFLVCYLTYKLIQLFRRRNGSEFQQKNSRHRLIIYSLIALCGLLRMAYCGLEFQSLNNTFDIQQTPQIWILELCPNLVLFSISCTFGYFWHEAYRNFDDNIEMISESNTLMKRLLIVLNLAVYTLYIVMGYDFLQSPYLIAILASTAAAAILIGAIFLVIHGTRLISKIKFVAQQYDRPIKSLSKFESMFILTIISCFVKIVGFGPMIYGVVNFETKNYFEYMFSHMDQAWILAAFIFQTASCFLGEFGFFISIIILLQKSAYKSKHSLAETEACSTKEVRTESDNLAEIDA